MKNIIIGNIKIPLPSSIGLGVPFINSSFSGLCNLQSARQHMYFLAKKDQLKQDAVLVSGIRFLAMALTSPFS
jgi:hypothetical protein